MFLIGCKISNYNGILDGGLAYIVLIRKVNDSKFSFVF